MTARSIIALFTFALAMVLLFSRLGHYALWDDESYTALAGIGVWNTGDTSAVIGHNVVAFYNGELLKNLRDRVTPPLPAYLVAPFVGLTNRSALAARMPFALCGAALIALMLWQVARRTQGNTPIILAALTLLGAVSMFLYFRQCRYYALTLLATPMLFYSYLQLRGRVRVIAILIWSLVLLGSNYIPFAAAGAALGIDYFLFGRRDLRFSPRELFTIFVPLTLIAAIVVSIWNPLGLESFQAESVHPFHDRLVTVWYFFRDFARAEFAASAIILAGIGIGFWKRDWILLRGILAVAVFVFVAALFSPQQISRVSVGDVRYMSAIIPVALAVQWRVLIDIAKFSRWLAISLATVSLACNALTLAPLTGQEWQSTTLAYATELLHPPPDPYTAAAAWINAHVNEGESIWVMPSQMKYPLMFHAPRAVYAWQLPSRPPVQKQFANLPPIHFQFEVPPDWIIAFGPMRDYVQSLKPPPGIRYQLVDDINVFGRDMYRPELFLRSFAPMKVDPTKSEGIYFYQLRRD